MILNEKDVTRVRTMLEQARRVVIICHVAPDGDAIGSSLALMHVLRSTGCDAQVVTPDMPPRSLNFLPGVRSVTVATAKPAKARELLMAADLVVCLDFNAMMRVDKLADAVEASPAPRILIDHHIHPEAFAQVTISHPEMPATAMLLYLVLEQMGWGARIDLRAAECLMTGILTDTGGLSYNSNTPELYRVVAELLRCGVDKDRLYKMIFDTNSEARLRLCGYAIYKKMCIFPEHKVALITLTKTELQEFGYQKGDTEALVNKPLSIPDVVCSVFMRQDDDNFVKVSTRSKGHYPVNLLCAQHFGGGGHENAAGGEVYGTLQEAVTRLLAALPDFDKYLQ